MTLVRVLNVSALQAPSPCVKRGVVCGLLPSWQDPCIQKEQHWRDKGTALLSALPVHPGGQPDPSQHFCGSYARCSLPKPFCIDSTFCCWQRQKEPGQLSLVP